MKLYFGVLLLVLSCSSQDYDLKDDYSDHTGSIEDTDGSGEVLNVTFEHKPERKINLISDNELSSVENDLTDRSETRHWIKFNLQDWIVKDNGTERRSKARVKTEVVKTTRLTTSTTTKKTPASIPLRDSNLTNSEMSEEDPEPESKSPVHKYPYVVSLQKKGSHYASGALVSKNWVLTSAGEFYNVRESIRLFRARLGSVNIKSGLLVPLKRIEIHPSYILERPNYDVALIGLAHDIDLSDSIAPIAFTKVADHVLSGKFISTYWPRILVKGEVLPSSAKEREKFNSMRVSTQHLIPWDQCYRNVNKQSEVLSESSLCLKPVLSHHSICSPDAGAPVVSDDGLWGITSGWTGKNCSTKLTPTVVTRTSAPAVRTWLTATLNS